MPCLVFLVSGSCTHRCMAQEFLGSCSLTVDTDHHERGSCFVAFVLTTRLIYCAVSFGNWCTLLVLDFYSSTSGCAPLVVVIVSRTVDWWTNSRTTTFQRPEFAWPSGSVCLRSHSVLDVQKQRQRSSRVVSVLGIRGMSNLVRISRESRCTKPLWARSSVSFVQILSRDDRS